MLLIDWFSANVTQIWSEIETEREREGDREKDRDRPMTVCATEGNGGAIMYKNWIEFICQLEIWIAIHYDIIFV